MLPYIRGMACEVLLARILYKSRLAYHDGQEWPASVMKGEPCSMKRRPPCRKIFVYCCPLILCCATPGCLVRMPPEASFCSCPGASTGACACGTCYTCCTCCKCRRWGGDRLDRRLYCVYPRSAGAASASPTDGECSGMILLCLMSHVPLYQSINSEY